MRKGGRDSEELGAAVIEGAMILLTLFTLIFAIYEAGRLFNVENVITNAAREGARSSVAPQTQTSLLPTAAQVKARVQQFLRSSSIEISDSAITVDQNVIRPAGCDLADPTCGRYTLVEVTVPYSFLTLPLLGDLSMNLYGSALMRNETSPKVN